jgi:hypothetical protein
MAAGARPPAEHAAVRMKDYIRCVLLEDLGSLEITSLCSIGIVSGSAAVESERIASLVRLYKDSHCAKRSPALFEQMLSIKANGLDWGDQDWWDKVCQVACVLYVNEENPKRTGGFAHKANVTNTAFPSFDDVFPAPHPRGWSVSGPIGGWGKVDEEAFERDREIFLAQRAANLAKHAAASELDRGALINIALDGGQRQYIPDPGDATIEGGDLVAVWFEDTGDVRVGTSLQGWVDSHVVKKRGTTYEHRFYIHYPVDNKQC